MLRSALGSAGLEGSVSGRRSLHQMLSEQSSQLYVGEEYCVWCLRLTAQDLLHVLSVAAADLRISVTWKTCQQQSDLIAG